jgi:hypothetical protein
MNANDDQTGMWKEAKSHETPEVAYSSVSKWENTQEYQVFG